MEGKSFPIFSILVIVLALVAVGVFYFLTKEQAVVSEQPQEDGTQIQEPDDTQTGPYAHIERIEAKHFYVDGTHTLAGEISMPTPCDLLEWETTVAESFPEQVTVNFTVINTADTCTQVITPQRFKVEFAASENATIRAQFMGRDVELNLIPAGDGETPDDFDLFIKG